MDSGVEGGAMAQAVAHVREQVGAAWRADLAVVLGSGLWPIADRVVDAQRIPYRALPGFPVSGVSSHKGELVAGRLGGRNVLVLSGRAHAYEAGNPAVMRGPMEMVKGLGARAVLLTNAAGSTRDRMHPGSLMALTDHINFAGMNPLIGEESEARFLDLSAAYDPALRAVMQRAASEVQVTLHEGVYMWLSGPSFETPAEIRMARLLGADAVGMSTVPEAILARFLGLKVAAISTITNLAAGMAGPLSHTETKVEGAKAAESLLQVLTRFLELLDDDHLG